MLDNYRYTVFFNIVEIERNFIKYIDQESNIIMMVCTTNMTNTLSIHYSKPNNKHYLHISYKL